METKNFANENELPVEEQRYQTALRQVRRQKGFYIHLIVYIGVNAFLIVNSVIFGKESLTNIELYYTPFFWGIGLAAHGLSVFSPGFLFGKDWEQRKIKELMEKERNRTHTF